MENTPKKVAKPRLQLVISVLVATSLILAELYVMINQPANVVLMIGIAVLVLIAVYFVIDAVVDCLKEKEIATSEQYDNIYRSEKASYMLLKKNLEEISHLIRDVAENNQTSDNSEEIINAQKALVKLSVGKNRESAEKIAAKISQLERRLESGLASISVNGIDEEKQDRLFIELNNLEASLNDRMQGLSDKLSGFQEEIERLADHIANINTEAINSVLNANVTAPVQVVQPVEELGKEIVLFEDIPAVELTDDIEFAELNMGDITFAEESDELGLSAFADETSELDDIVSLLEDTADEPFNELEEEDDVLNQLLEAEEEVEEFDVLEELAKLTDEEPLEEVAPELELESLVELEPAAEPEPAPIVEEVKPTPPPAPADNGGKMGQDDIAALIASMTGGDAAPAAEPEPAPVVEEPKPTLSPAPAGDGGKMNQDDIAALIASMTGN